MLTLTNIYWKVVLSFILLYLNPDILISFSFRNKSSETLPPDPRLKPQSCLLIQPPPPRGGRKAAVSTRTNMHILVDTGLRVSDNRLYKSPTHVFISFVFNCLPTTVL